MLPPPWDPLVGEIEELAARVVAERRIVRSELAAVLDGSELGPDGLAIVERLLAAYVAGGAREERRRHDKLRATAADAQGGGLGNATAGAGTTYRDPG